MATVQNAVPIARPNAQRAKVMVDS
jgi:hypothetical protein